jgi:hypothetical protein
MVCEEYYGALIAASLGLCGVLSAIVGSFVLFACVWKPVDWRLAPLKEAADRICSHPQLGPIVQSRLFQITIGPLSFIAVSGLMLLLTW